MSVLATILADDSFKGGILLLGVLVAIVSVWSARVTARKKQTVDALFAARSDDTLQEGMKCIVRIHDGTDSNLQSWAKKDKKDTPEAKSIRYVLNHWEYVSIGVQHGIFDEEMYRKASYTTATSLYQKALPFMEMARREEGRPTIYQEFEWLAKRWLSKPLKGRAVK